MGKPDWLEGEEGVGRHPRYLTQEISVKLSEILGGTM